MVIKMKQWTKKKKIALGILFIAVLAAAGVIAAALNYRAVQEGQKLFQVEIISQRDSYYRTQPCETQEAYLGEFLRTFEGCEWQESEYGIYITGFDGKLEDKDNQYWWCVTVNGEAANTGADEIPLRDGDVYGFVLKQGW